MAGLLEALFGPDGIGGQSGAVGKVADQGILNTVLGGAGKVIAPVGNTAVGGLGDWVADVVTKNPLEILKNPMSVLNDRGEPSWTRVLFPEFRRNDMRNKEMAAKAKQLEATTASLSMLGDMGKFLQGLKPDQRAPYVQQFEAAGGTPEQSNAALGLASAADQESEIARQAILAEDPTLPHGLLKGLTPEKGLSTLVGLRAAKATAAERNKPDYTPAEKAVDAWVRANPGASPEQVARVRAEVTKAEVLGQGKSSQPMVTFNPDGTPSAMGPASDVVAFGAQTAKDRALGQIDAVDRAKATINDIREIARTNKGAFGFAGGVKGTAQNLAMQGKAFTSLRDSARADAVAGRLDSNVQLGLFDPNIDELTVFENTLAYAIARSQSDDGRVSDADYNAAIGTIRGGGASGGWLANSESTLARMDALEKDLDRVRKRSRLRAGASGKPQSGVQAALEGGSPAAPPKKKFGRKGKPAEAPEDYPLDTSALPTNPKERSAMAAQLVGQDRARGLGEADIINRLKARGFSKEDVSGIPR